MTFPNADKLLLIIFASSKVCPLAPVLLIISVVLGQVGYLKKEKKRRTKREEQKEKRKKRRKKDGRLFNETFQNLAVRVEHSRDQLDS